MSTEPKPAAVFAPCSALDLPRIAMVVPAKDGRAMVTVTAETATSMQFEWWAKKMLLNDIGIQLSHGFWPVSSRVKFCSFLLFMGKVAFDK